MKLDEQFREETKKESHVVSDIGEIFYSDDYVFWLEKSILTVTNTIDDKDFYCWNKDTISKKCENICISCSKYKGNNI